MGTIGDIVEKYTCIYVYIYIYIYAYTCIYVCIYIHIHTHTHIHMYQRQGSVWKHLFSKCGKSGEGLWLKWIWGGAKGWGWKMVKSEECQVRLHSWVLGTNCTKIKW